MARPEAALIEESDFYSLAHTVVPSCEYSITPWGVCEGLVKKVFEGTSRNASKDAPPIMLGSCAEIAEASIVLATAKPGVAVRHINTDVVADPAKKGYEHLGQRHYGKAPWIYLPILIANAHSGWFPEGSHTLLLEQGVPEAERTSNHPEDQGKLYIARGAGMNGVPDNCTFFCQSMISPDRPGTLCKPQHLEDTFEMGTNFFVFGGNGCVAAIRAVLEKTHGFSFSESPQGYERWREQSKAIAAVAGNYPNWPANALQVAEVNNPPRG